MKCIITHNRNVIIRSRLCVQMCVRVRCVCVCIFMQSYTEVHISLCNVAFEMEQTYGTF